MTDPQHSYYNRWFHGPNLLPIIGTIVQLLIVAAVGRLDFEENSLRIRFPFIFYVVLFPCNVLLIVPLIRRLIKYPQFSFKWSARTRHAGPKQSEIGTLVSFLFYLGLLVANISVYVIFLNLIIHEGEKSFVFNQKKHHQWTNFVHLLSGTVISHSVFMFLLFRQVQISLRAIRYAPFHGDSPHRPIPFNGSIQNSSSQNTPLIDPNEQSTDSYSREYNNNSYRPLQPITSFEIPTNNPYENV